MNSLEPADRFAAVIKAMAGPLGLKVALAPRGWDISSAHGRVWVWVAESNEVQFHFDLYQSRTFDLAEAESAIQAYQALIQFAKDLQDRYDWGACQPLVEIPVR